MSNRDCDFPELELSEAERTWLEAVYEEFREGDEVVPRILKAKLEDQLPRDFNPKEIDRRLLSGPTTLTLLGVYHVDPHSSLLDLLRVTLQHVMNAFQRTSLRESDSSECLR